MREVLTYLLQVSITVACSFLVYRICFARDSHHRIKRFVLLFLLAAVFVLPLCRITIMKEAIVGNVVSTIITTDEGNIYDPQQAEQHSQIVASDSVPVFWHAVLDIIAIIYITGVASMLIYTLAGVARVRKIMKKALRRVVYNNIEIVLIADNINPFCFKGRIIMAESDYTAEDAEMIVQHEAVHIRQHHNIDLTIINIAAALLWFNPFVWLLKRDLILVHEFSADSGVIESGINAKKYQYLLISKNLCENSLLPVANHFRTSNLHKRIISMKRKQSRASALKLLLLQRVSKARFRVNRGRYDIASSAFSIQ